MALPSSGLWRRVLARPRRPWALVAGLLLAGAAPTSAQQRLTSFVDPFIGTGGHGHVFIGANVPFGAVQLGPQQIFKGWDWCSGYHYSDSLLTGFSHTHLSGTGASDLGDVLIMPYTGALKTDKGQQKAPHQGYLSRYSHQREVARPGYYAVTLDDYGIRAELTSTARVGLHRYTFPKGSQPARIIIDLKEGISDKATDTELRQVDAQTFVGHRFSHGWANHQQLFFAIKVSAPAPEFALFNEAQALGGKTGQGPAVKGVLSWAQAPAAPLLLKVGISPVSTDNALANIQAELPGWDFAAVQKAADGQWEQELGKIAIESPDPVVRRIFYTSLYHAWFAPALFNDANRDYRGTDGKIYPRAAFNNYSIYSLWDTYRTEHSLFTLAQPERVPDMMQAMLAIGRQQGKLPIWHLMGNETNTMVGYSAAPVLAEAYLKGTPGLDGRQVLAALEVSSTRDDEGTQYVKTLGFIPADKENESVAKAMEYAIDDWSIAQVAKKLGDKEAYDTYSKRAKYYQKYFDPKTRFMRGVTSEGKYQLPFNPFQSIHRMNPYTEGNAWQYTWLVPHDVPGLIQLFGSEAAFVEKLDSLFVVQGSLGESASPDISGLIGMYAHGNEPSHATTYLYAYAGQQWKTAAKVRQVLREMYLDKPDGISGNEDCGQMSAWYIMSAMGFYPVSPSSLAYVLGSPVVNKATIRLPQGKTFVMEALNNSPQNLYIQSATLNGKPYANTYLLHRDVVAGGKLQLTMGSQPNKTFGAAAANRPKDVY
ncbi:glycoside hydrolase family 92 protein [Hymenobacter sp. RP-2-7]|uniref:Glycoside hydrolase family 92 protein n=1 Tax=Hymenobacter polaris TaxID=2682546 RepID=A0A7Y0FNW7_9BACT|nr:GH92 family glycosyl hydrolase [Hymenobacter polaris]NML66960.1 glycoside hydrolase family 92 protein [Hymenobacter polaris]